MITEIFIFFLITFLWIISGWEALSQLTRGRIRKLENGNDLFAKKMEKWFVNKSAYQTVYRILLFFNISIIASLLFDIVHKKFFFKFPSLSQNLTSFGHILAHVIIAAVITVFLIIISESVMRIFVSKYFIQTLKITIPVINFLHYTLLYPFMLLINFLKKKVQRSQNLKSEDKASTEDEILSLLEDDSSKSENSSLEEEERQMIKGIFELNDTDVKEIMTPRVDVIAIPSNASLEEAVDLFTKSGHSRIPVYLKTIDEITGVILAKDFLATEKIKDKSLTQLSHKPIYVPETKQIGELLNEFKGSRNHFSVIIDEYGGTAGIITLEDILEEIVGEIHDEHETIEESTPRFSPDGSVELDARTLIDEVNDLFKIKLPEDEDVDTIRGFLCGRLGKIPEPGLETTIDNLLDIKVLKADKRRVLTLKIKKNI